MKRKYILYLLFGLSILIVPTVVYLFFLIPQMKEEYIVLMSSGGIICPAGLTIAKNIPKESKFSSIAKLAVNSTTLLITITLVQRFINQLIVLAIIIIVSFILYSILKIKYKVEREKFKNAQLAREITRSVNEIAK